MDRWIATCVGRRVFDLGQPLHAGMPNHPAHPPFHLSLAMRHGDYLAPNGFSAADEVVVLSGHSSTHIDALGHVSEHGRLYGGLDAAASQGNRGMKAHGIETVPPIACRGVLLDVLAALRVDCLGAGQAVKAADLEACARQQKVEVRSGDAVLVRTGWIRHWREPALYLGREGGAPGPDESAARWLAERGVRATGSDTNAYEVTGPGRQGYPAHVVLLARHGIPIMEMLFLDELAAAGAYEFLFVASPLKLVGATGSPVRPLAFA